MSLPSSTKLLRAHRASGRVRNRRVPASPRSRAVIQTPGNDSRRPSARIAAHECVQITCSWLYTPRGTHPPKSSVVVCRYLSPGRSGRRRGPVRSEHLSRGRSPTGMFGRRRRHQPRWGVPRCLVLPICSIVEPAADDQTHELRLQMEAQSGVEVLGVVRLESDVLAGHGAHEVSDHCCRDATPADG
jgi:hypothetical protein